MTLLPLSNTPLVPPRTPSYPLVPPRTHPYLPRTPSYPPRTPPVPPLYPLVPPPVPIGDDSVRMERAPFKKTALATTEACLLVGLQYILGPPTLCVQRLTLLGHVNATMSLTYRDIGTRGTRVRGYTGYEGTRVRGYEGTRVRGCEGTRIRGYEDTRIRGYEGTRVRGYEGTRV